MVNVYLKRIPIVFFLLTAVFICGCSLFHERPFSPFQEPLPPDLDPAGIVRLLEKRSQAHDNLWASGKIVLSGKPFKGKTFFNATLLYNQPGDLRLRGSRLVTSTLFEFIINDDRVALALNRDKLWYLGAREELLSNPEITFGMDPLSLPSALQIEQELLYLLKSGEIKSWKKTGDGYIFVSRVRNGVKKAFLLRERDLLVKQAAVYGSAGKQILRLEYEYYDVFGEEILPGKLNAVFPRTDVNAEISIDEYKRPPEFHEKVFSIVPPPGFETRPLHELLRSGAQPRP